MPVSFSPSTCLCNCDSEAEKRTTLSASASSRPFSPSPTVVTRANFTVGAPSSTHNQHHPSTKGQQLRHLFSRSFDQDHPIYLYSTPTESFFLRDTHPSQSRPNHPRWSRRQSSTTRWASAPARPRTISRKPTGKAALSSVLSISSASSVFWSFLRLKPLSSSTYPSDLTSLHRQKRDRELTPHLGKLL